MQNLLNPIEDLVQVLKTPIKLADSSSLNRLSNSVNIASDMRIAVNDGYILKVKQQGVEVSGGNDPYDTEAYMKAQKMAGSLSTKTETKSTKSVNSTGETGNTKELSEAEEMAIFKKEFYAEIDKIPRNRTITNVAINISEEAFKNMKDDPEYREKILSALKRDLTSSFAPLEASMVLTVGATAKDYRGDSWSGVNNQSEFFARSQNSFYKKTSNKKDRQKELLEEYLEKRAQVKKQQQEMLNEKIAKQEQERSRLLRSWNNERLLSKASNAYEANAMTEAVTDSAFSLG